MVETGNIKRHKTLGWATAILSTIMVPLGQIGVSSGAAPDYAPQFLSLEFGEMIGFATFVTAGILWRKNLAAHKRLMILSAVAISDAGFARIWLNGFKVVPPGHFGWWLQYYWGIALMLIAMMAWDWWKRGRVHPAVLAGAALLWTCQLIATELFFSPTWKAMMVALVKRLRAVRRFRRSTVALILVRSQRPPAACWWRRWCPAVRRR